MPRFPAILERPAEVCMLWNVSQTYSQKCFPLTGSVTHFRMCFYLFGCEQKLWSRCGHLIYFVQLPSQPDTKHESRASTNEDQMQKIDRFSTPGTCISTVSAVICVAYQLFGSNWFLQLHSKPTNGACQQSRFQWLRQNERLLLGPFHLRHCRNKRQQIH